MLHASRSTLHASRLTLHAYSCKSPERTFTGAAAMKKSKTSSAANETRSARPCSRLDPQWSGYGPILPQRTSRKPETGPNADSSRKPETGPGPADPPSVLSLISPSSPKQLGMVSPELSTCLADRNPGSARGRFVGNRGDPPGRLGSRAVGSGIEPGRPDGSWRRRTSYRADNHGLAGVLAGSDRPACPGLDLRLLLDGRVVHLLAASQ